MQRRIGLTGGIASGKSSISRFLCDSKNLPILDADLYSREALTSNPTLIDAVLARYGDEVRAKDSQLSCCIDRKSLGNIVFSNSAERYWLEQLIHPFVYRKFLLDLEFYKGEPALVLMIPLLFEAGFTDLCSEIWLIDCDIEQQYERLMQRDKISLKDASFRIQAQWPLSVKRKYADFIIDNRGDPNTWLDTVNLMI